MSINIDVSIFTKEQGAFGNVTGEISLPIVPGVGDTISFAFPVDAEAIAPQGFSGLLKVKERVILVGKSAGDILRSLEDIVVDTRADAIELSEYFARAFALFVSAYAE